MAALSLADPDLNLDLLEHAELVQLAKAQRLKANRSRAELVRSLTSIRGGRAAEVDIEAFHADAQPGRRMLAPALKGGGALIVAVVCAPLGFWLGHSACSCP